MNALCYAGTDSEDASSSLYNIAVTVFFCGTRGPATAEVGRYCIWPAALPRTPASHPVQAGKETASVARSQ